jgi:hypothetical protein
VEVGQVRGLQESQGGQVEVVRGIGLGKVKGEVGKGGRAGSHHVHGSTCTQ